ncbi:MAG: glycoside hydrolase family 9 protein [Oscillospiraceae bacterium]|nr:glycoside hydrolase family 9 protein [Oscillospiraceae bacterium]
MKRILSAIMAVVIAITLAPTMSANTESGGTNATNYARLLQYLLYFYDANMCGTDVSTESGITWRGACHAQDAAIALPAELGAVLGKETIDLSGGFHDAGDHIKFGVTASYSAMVLGLAYREFGEAFVQTGQDEHMEIILKRFAEYLRKCTLLNADGTLLAYAYQVGDGRDHSFWGQPENKPNGGDTPARIAYFITQANIAQTHGTVHNLGTDQLMAAAGALAMSYYHFKNPDDLTHALALYNAAIEWDKFARGDALDANSFYRRNDGKNSRFPNGNGVGLWQDYGAAAAMWLHVGTGEAASQYSEDATSLIRNGTVTRNSVTIGEMPPPGTWGAYSAGQDYWPMSWDSAWQISSALQGTTASANRMRSDMYHLNDAVLANTTNYVFVHQWGSAVMNAGLQFSGLIHDKITGTQRYTAWARGQTDYLMGANPIGRCYVTGFAENSVRHTHHSGASGYSTQPGRNETRPQLNLLVGALAGGPINAAGIHNDVEDDYVGNEVGITYNAPFIGAVAGLYLAATPAERSAMMTDTAIDSVKPTHIFPRTPPECELCGVCEVCDPPVIGCGNCGTCEVCEPEPPVPDVITITRESIAEACQVCGVEKVWRVTTLSVNGVVTQQRRGAKRSSDGELLGLCELSANAAANAIS